MTRPDDQQTALLPPMKWNAWGDPEEAKPLSDGIRSLLKQALGVEDSTDRRARARAGAAAAVRAVGADRDGLTAIVGAEYCSVDDRGRLLRAGGKSTLDLLRRKDSGVQDAPDAVLLPGDDDEIAAILQLLRAAQHRRRPVRRWHQRGRRPGSHPRRIQGRGVAGPAAARTSCTRSTRSPEKPNWAPG